MFLFIYLLIYLPDNEMIYSDHVDEIYINCTIKRMMGSQASCFIAGFINLFCHQTLSDIKHFLFGVCQIERVFSVLRIIERFYGFYPESSFLDYAS